MFLAQVSLVHCRHNAQLVLLYQHIQLWLCQQILNIHSTLDVELFIAIFEAARLVEVHLHRQMYLQSLFAVAGLRNCVL